MAPEVEMLGHSDHVVLVLWIPFDQLSQDLDLDQSLSVEPLLIANDLDSDRQTRFVISALQHLAKGPFAQDANDFVSITEMVALDDNVVSPLVVKAVVVDLAIGLCRPSDSMRGVVVDLIKVEHLFPLEV